jgi:hypothetical protein
MDTLTRKLHREKFWKELRYSIAWPFVNILCLFRQHAFWERETIIEAMTTGHSKRCRWCNRLVMKKFYRRK